MTFEEALKTMREGKKVRRNGFTCCLFMEAGVIFTTYLYQSKKKLTSVKEYFWLCDILAEDWEIVDNKSERRTNG